MLLCYAGYTMNRSLSALHAILRLADADGATQRLAMEVIAQPPAQRDRLIRQMRALYCAGIARSVPSKATIARMGDVLESRVRDQVAEILARGGGTIGTA
jgi:hypothetical protein